MANIVKILCKMANIVKILCKMANLVKILCKMANTVKMNFQIPHDQNKLCAINEYIFFQTK